MVDFANQDFADYVSEALGDMVVSRSLAHGELTITIGAESIVRVLTLLRDDPQTQFITLLDVCGVDFPDRERRFEVVYHLLSPRQNARIRIKAMVGEDETIASVTEVHPAADWFEREAYDLYGILFTGHPDLRRLLTDYGFEGHPLRKDFPLTGFVEVHYDEERKQVVYEPVDLRQEFRNFDFLSPWEGIDHTLPGDEKAGQ